MPEEPFVQSPSVYMDGGTLVFRASSFGWCSQWLTRVYRGQMPSAPPDNIRKAMDFGTEHEQEVLDRLKDGFNDSGRGIGLDDIASFKYLGKYEFETWGLKMVPAPNGEQCRVELPVGNVMLPDANGQMVKTPMVVRMHLDGVGQRFARYAPSGTDHRVNDVVKNYLLEVKIMAPGNDPSKNKQYEWQMAVQWHAMKKHVDAMLLVVGWKDEARENVDAIEPRLVDVDELPSLRDIRLRAKMLGEMFAEEGELPACDVAMYPCGFWTEHDGRGVWEKEQVAEWVAGADDKAELARLVKLRANAKHKEKEAGDESRRWADDRKKYDKMIAETVGWGTEVTVDGWRIKTTETEMAEQIRKAHTRRVVTVEPVEKEG